MVLIAAGVALAGPAATWLVTRHLLWPTPPYTPMTCMARIGGACVIGMSGHLHLHPLPSRVRLPWGETALVSSAEACRAFTFQRATELAAESAYYRHLDLPECTDTDGGRRVGMRNVHFSDAALGVVGYFHVSGAPKGAQIITGLDSIAGCNVRWKVVPGAVSVDTAKMNDVPIYSVQYLDEVRRCTLQHPNEWMDLDLVRLVLRDGM